MELLEKCFSLVEVIKDRLDASSAFKDEKGRCKEMLITLKPVLRDASKSAISPEHKETFEGVLNNIQRDLQGLRNVLVECENNTVWTTWVRPNKYRNKFGKLVTNINQFNPFSIRP